MKDKIFAVTLKLLIYKGKKTGGTFGTICLYVGMRLSISLSPRSFKFRPIEANVSKFKGYNLNRCITFYTTFQVVKEQKKVPKVSQDQNCIVDLLCWSGSRISIFASHSFDQPASSITDETWNMHSCAFIFHLIRSSIKRISLCYDSIEIKSKISLR